MLGLFTNSIIMMISRPKCQGTRGAAVSEIRIGCEETLNFIWPRSAIEIKGIDPDDRVLAFKIDNLNEFVDWARETNCRDLRSLDGPCDFAMAAMFAALDALIASPSDARSGQLAQGCLSAVIKLGTFVKPKRKNRRMRSKEGPRFYSTELVAYIRHKVDTEWTWAETLKH
ncbi:hypothetical protein [Methylobacterium sp. D48H]